jgi:hypothetical protein
VRQLQVVGISDDGEALLLGQGAGKPSHRLRVDDKLRAAVRGQLAAVNSDRRTESALTPKDMQARLREGASPEEVAKEAGIPVARVLPYAAPVIAERDRIVEQARAAVLHRSRGPNGERLLGEVVDAHLHDAAGFKPDSVEWTAQRRRDGAWVVLLAYAARGGRRTASWLWRPLERDLTSLDSSATRLAVEETTVSRRRPAPRAAKPAAGGGGEEAGKEGGKPKARKSARRPAAKKTATTTVKKTIAKKTPARSTSSKKTAVRKAVVKPPTAKRPAARSKPAKKSPARTAKQATATKRSRPTPVAKPVTVAPSRPTVVPDPVLEPRIETPPPIVVIPRSEPEPEPQPEAEPIVARRPGQRVPLPSWSDVLLGVAPPEPTRDAGTRRRRKSG